MRVTVFAETVHDSVSDTAFELLTRASALAKQADITALVITSGVPESDLERLARSNAGNVVVYQSNRLGFLDIETYSRVLEDYCHKYDPDVILGAATSFGRTLFPFAAMRLHTGLTADCTSLEEEPETGLLLQTRPAIGGNVTATIKTPFHRPQMATVRPHSVPPISLSADNTPGRVIRNQIPDSLFTSVTPKLLRSVPLQSSEELANAKRIVAVGKGIKRASNIEVARQLAEKLGASLGATREIVDRGWLPHSVQIGLSGKTVTPDLYIALGISGAIQHLAGMRTAKKIIAVNIDPDAPIFQIADLGIVGDIFEIIPNWLEQKAAIWNTTQLPRKSQTGSR